MGLYDQERGEPSLRREDIKRDVDKTDTLRATPFTDEVFDDRPARRDGAGLPVTLIAGVALGAVLVGGVVWYAFKGAGGPQLAPGEVQTIKADAAPYKMKPDNPGGMQVENQDKLVYDRVAKGAAPKREENLLPPPEEPKEPPKAAAPKVTEPVTEVAKAPEPKEPPKEPPKDIGKAPEPKEPAKAPEVKAPPAEKTMESIVKEANETSQPKEAAKETAKPAAPSSDAAALAAAATKAPGAPAPAKASEPAAKPAAKSEEVQTAAVTPTAPVTAPIAAGAFQIQLVSVPSEDAAQSEWKRISGRHKDLFAALSPSVTKADLGDKGIYYRLRAGPLADKAAADSLCAALAADKIGCIVVKP